MPPEALVRKSLRRPAANKAKIPAGDIWAAWGSVGLFRAFLPCCSGVIGCWIRPYLAEIWQLEDGTRCRLGEVELPRPGLAGQLPGDAAAVWGPDAPPKWGRGLFGVANSGCLSFCADVDGVIMVVGRFWVVL